MGPARPLLRLRALRLPAGHHHHGEGADRRLHPDGGDDRLRRGLRAVREGRRPRSRTARRSAATRSRRRSRSATSTSSPRRTSAATCSARRASSAACSRTCATSRSSATSAAPGSSTRSSWSRTATRRSGFSDEEGEWLLRGFLSGELYRRGLICRADDRGDPVIQLAPPLICDTEQFEEIGSILRSVLEEAWEKVDVPAERTRREPARSMLTVAEPARRARPRARRSTAGAAERRIRWVHISELEDPTPFLSGGELLLTTGHQPDERPPGSASSSACSPTRDAAGLGFGTGFDHAELPEALVEEARARELPLFEIPYEMPFIALTECAFTKLVNERLLGARARDRGPRPARGPGARRARSRRGDARDRRVGRRRGAAARRPRPRARPPSRRSAASRQAAVAAIRAEVSERSEAGRQAMFVAEDGTLAGRAVAVPVPIGGSGPRGHWLVVARRSGKVGDLERLIARQAAMVVALELMRERAVGETERRLAGDVLAEALGGNLGADELRGRLQPFGIDGRVAVLLFELERAADDAEMLAAALRGAGVAGARRRQRRRRPAAALRDRRPGRPRPGRARPRGPRAAADGGADRPARRRQPARSGRLAAPRLPRGALRARGDRARQRQRARGRLPSRPRRLHAAALAPGRRGAADLRREPARADRGGRGRVRPGAAALARGVHRAQRPVGAGGPRSLLPPPHAPLPDPQDRGAHRPRPQPGPGPDRALAGAAGAGAGEVIAMRVAVLGAGGTIAPAIVRDLADPTEIESMILLDIAGEKARAVAAAHGGGKAAADELDAGAAARSPSARRLRRADQLGLLPAQRRRDGGLPDGRLPLPRPRRALLDDRAAARRRPAVRGRRPARRPRHRLLAGEDEPARRPRRR